ncbi:MAG TPA: TIGR03435 family protein [Acidobacteriaceae bacterium]|nr:TIGR03435 family protein [Acidobacteriaceae bacterium]
MRSGTLAIGIFWVAATVLDQTSSGMRAAAPTKLPAWDAISVHPADPDQCRGGGLRFTADGVIVSCAPLMFPVQVAYNVTESSRVIGAPEWTKTGDRWNIDAKVAPEDVAAFGKLSYEDRSRMLQPLLAERFHLKAHMEQREMPVYEAVIAKGGPKLKEATEQDTKKSMISFSGSGKIECKGMALSNVLSMLNSEVGRNVVDKTGLTGKYDITLEYVPAAKTGTDETGGPSVFTAVEEQLGLKLVPGKDPLDVLVIDSVERPTAN